MSLYKNAEQTILKRRVTAQQQADTVYRRALKDKQFADIDSRMGALLPQIARCEALNEDSTEYSRVYAALLVERDLQLQKLGLSPAQLKPLYACASCEDTGYLQGRPCMCLKREINTSLSDLYGSPGVTHHSFDSSMPHNNQELSCLVPYYDNMLKYCQAFPESKFCTHIFSGAPGTGKTRLASCVVNKLQGSGHSVLFVSAFKLNDIFLKYHLDFAGQGRGYLNALLLCDLLVIDDLGTENTLRNVTHEYLLSVLSDRIASKKHTLITTNLNSPQLRTHYDERLHSRLTDKNNCFIFNFSGCDIRKQAF